jgi:hypothetical protein
MAPSCLPKYMEIPESQLTPLDLLAQYSTYNINLWSSRSTHQASTLGRYSQSHHLLITIRLVTSPTGHISPSPSPPLRRGSSESLAHAPHSCRKHTTSELGVTGIRLPHTRTAYLSYRQLSIARKPAFLSPCLVWNPEP